VFIDNNISDISVEISVVAEAYVLVEAPGYEDWEMGVNAFCEPVVGAALGD
jgi:hypothetical protein